MTKTKAAAWHLLASAAVSGATYCLFRLVWYPGALFDASGAGSVFAMVIGVDVVIGPMLTWLVFRQGKPSLKFDLGVIVLLQLVALSYGLFTLFSGRPVFVAALGHRFDLVQATEVGQSDLARANRSLPMLGPEWVGIARPTDPKVREMVLFGSLAGAGDYGNMPQYHAPLSSMRAEILANASPVSKLKAINSNSAAVIDAWLAARNRRAEDVVFQGLKARTEDMAVILDAKTAEVIGIAPFKPWD